MELLAPIPFDFLIGSVHWVGGWAIDSSDVTGEFERRGIDRAWEEYFDLVDDLAARGVVDVLAHVDLCKKFGYRPATEPIHLYQKGRRRSGRHRAWPSRFRARVCEGRSVRSTHLHSFPDVPAGPVPITFASDAHQPADAGFAFDALKSWPRPPATAHISGTPRGWPRGPPNLNP